MCYLPVIKKGISFLRAGTFRMFFKLRRIYLDTKIKPNNKILFKKTTCESFNPVLEVFASVNNKYLFGN